MTVYGASDERRVEHVTAHDRRAIGRRVRRRGPHDGSDLMPAGDCLSNEVRTAASGRAKHDQPHERNRIASRNPPWSSSFRPVKAASGFSLRS